MSLHIRLNMIVKNEAAVIARCLDSVVPYVDSWVIVDTGSTDDTPDIIKRMLKTKPGELHHRPWCGFDVNRTEAMRLALADGANYVFTIDADDVFIPDSKFSWNGITDDLISIQVRETLGESYYRPLLASSRIPWVWHGVLHERLHTDAAFTSERLIGAHILYGRDGARHKDRQQRLLSDAAALSRALQDDPDNIRYTLYLAQAQRDLGQWESAMNSYGCVEKMSGGGELAWYAKYQRAMLNTCMEKSRAQVIGAFLDAYASRPTRAEPLMSLTRWLRVHGDVRMGLVFARMVQGIKLPVTEQFTPDPQCYGWWQKDELAVLLDQSGEHTLAHQLFTDLYISPQLPLQEMKRTRQSMALNHESGNPIAPIS